MLQDWYIAELIRVNKRLKYMARKAAKGSLGREGYLQPDRDLLRRTMGVRDGIGDTYV